MQSQYDDVIYALRIYHDIPRLIAEEWNEIRRCREEREKIPAPAGTGADGDQTAQLAVKDRETLFQGEIESRLARIDELRRTREWLRKGLSGVNLYDRQILDLAYIGPADAAQRLSWRRKNWSEIARETSYSSATVRRRAGRALKKIQMMKGEENLEQT